VLRRLRALTPPIEEWQLILKQAAPPRSGVLTRRCCVESISAITRDASHDPVRDPSAACVFWASLPAVRLTANSLGPARYPASGRFAARLPRGLAGCG
jgi:hypothetical protein